MAKQYYKIPYGLDSSYGDMVIAIQGKSGMGMRPLPVKIILSYLGSAMACWFCLTSTFISGGTAIHKGLFITLWIMLTMVLLKNDPTNRMQIEIIPSLFRYMKKSNRLVITRSTANAAPFYHLSNIKSIGRNGLITFVDGSYGYMYRVIGSASVLLFDADKNAILNQVDGFYRKMQPDVNLIFITTKASQTTYKQINALKRRYDAMQYRDPELMELAEEQFRCLKEYVGDGFKSIHQYMILKADNKELLSMAKNTLQSEVEKSTMMFKRCVAMRYDDIIAALELIYKGKGR